MDELVADAFVFHPPSGPVEIMSVDDWLDSQSPAGSWERVVLVPSSEAETNPDQEYWDSDEETARLERIAMYFSVEEYDRYEGDDC